MKRNSFKKLASMVRRDTNESQNIIINEKFKGFDSRCKDEIDELKMIFYKFFVPEGNKD